MNSSTASNSSCGLGLRAWILPTLWGLGAAFSAAGVTVLFVRTHLPLPLRAVIAVLPLIPCVGYVLCIVRMLRRVDELQRRIQLEAIGFAFGATVIVSMGDDLLEQAKVVPTVHWGWTGLWVVMALLWSLGNVIAVRRYR